MTTPREFFISRNFPSIKDRINEFISSRWFIIAIMILSIAGNTLSIELFTYGVFTLLFFYICFFGDDLLPLASMIICAYIIPSSKNNPGRREVTIFTPGHGGIAIICMAAIIAISLIYRIIRDRKIFFKKKYPLLVGIGLLTVAYICGGLGSNVTPDVQVKSSLFGLAQGLSVGLPYFLLSGSVDWKKAKSDYFSWVGVSVGCILLAEILWLYLTAGVVTNSVIDRSLIFTGWGICNNVGGTLMLMIPFAFHLTLKDHHRSWFGAVLASAFLLGVFFTCSRNAIFTGSAIYGVCFLLTLRYAHNRKYTAATVIIFGVSLLLIFLIRSEDILKLFNIVVKKGLKPSARDKIFKEGVKQFTGTPLFGSSFYSPGYVPYDASKVDAFSAVIPARWHNTFVQLMTSTGILGVGTYIIHRAQTVKLFIDKRSPDTVFIALSIAALLISSQLDCHFFNFGPTLFYSMGLAFIENAKLPQQAQQEDR